MPAIGETFDLTQEGTGGSGHPFKFKGGDHIRMLAVAELLQGLGINLAETGREDHCPNLQLPLFRLLLKINGMTLTDRYADLTGLMLQKEAGIRIDVIGGRNGLGVIDMDRPGNCQPFIIGIHMMLGTILGTESTGSTGIGVNIAWPHIDRGGEISCCSFQCQKISIGQHFNIGRPTGLYQLWRQDSE